MTLKKRLNPWSESFSSSLKYSKSSSPQLKPLSGNNTIVKLSHSIVEKRR